MIKNLVFRLIEMAKYFKIKLFNKRKYKNKSDDNYPMW